MPLTLIEAAKIYELNGETYKSGVVETISGASPVLNVMQFDDIRGNAVKFTQEDTLPEPEFRGVNEAQPQDTGTFTPQTESLTILTLDIDVDCFIVDTMGEGQRTIQEAMALKGFAWKWTNSFINGDGAVNPREFDGLKKRATGTQLIDAGSTSGGDALSLYNLDTVIDLVDDPMPGEQKVIFMNNFLCLRMDALLRNSGLTGFVQIEKDQFGNPMTRYRGLEIKKLRQNTRGQEILPFTEANPGGGTPASTSVYVANIGIGQLCGIQWNSGTNNTAGLPGGIMIQDFGRVQDKACFRTRIDWYTGMAAYNKRCFARLRGVKNAAVTA
jgi:hypothetical protein